MADHAPSSRDVAIRAGGVFLPGTLTLPDGPHGIVLFAHGSGSSARARATRSSRASARRGLGTLLFDLLTPAEDRVHASVSTSRCWPDACGGHRLAAPGRHTADCRLALRCEHRRRRRADRGAARRDRRRHRVARRTTGPRGRSARARAGADAAHCRRRGRRDRVEPRSVGAPAVHLLEIVPGATHLFEEPGTLEHVAELAAAWFRHWLGADGRSPGAPSRSRLALSLARPQPRRPTRGRSPEARGRAYSCAGASSAGLCPRFSTMMQSVVRMRLAIDAAFCSPRRVTFVGSMMPIATTSPNSPVAAL